MNDHSRMTVSWSTALITGALLLGIGGGAVFLIMRGTSSTPSSLPSQAASNSATPQRESPGRSSIPPRTTDDIVVTLSPEAIQRAGIAVATVTAGTMSSGLRVPGAVEPNAYKQVVVTPITSGRVTRTLVELGQRVNQGQPVAELFSPELAEAETKYLAAQADLEAHERELDRTQKLVDIGAASRQELERLHADHTAKLTAVASARSHLQLLGLSADAIAALAPGREAAALVTVPAPMAGVVTERMANPGLNVDPSTKLVTVVDLSTVWVVADVFEQDLARIRIGAPAIVTTTASPGTALNGRVSYIDPAVNPQTRTAKVRIEVANPRGELRLGMFADVSLELPGQVSGVRIPAGAIQHVDDRTVVYMADTKQPGRFTERAVRVGSGSGIDVEVVSGLHPGETVVTTGSFSVRAERERLGPSNARTPSAP
jgi:cobalt-zinc-cadmium efflux system membrane fusion protein